MMSLSEAVYTSAIPVLRLSIFIALRAITSNPARILKLDKKGKIEIGADADLCILDKETLDIDTVIAKGEIMVQEKEVKVWGTFEKSF